MNISIWKRFAGLCVAGLLLATVAACSDQNQIDASDVNGYNYTDYYIDQFSIANEGQGLSAGGSNMLPKEKGEERSESGGMCCIGIPRHWRPGMKVVVNWDVDKLQDGKTPGEWYTATAEVPPYGPNNYNFWVHFLPGDRIRIQVQDTPQMPVKPSDNDPYIVQGVLDTELNKEE